jgi:hypothetical protein
VGIPHAGKTCSAGFGTPSGLVRVEVLPQEQVPVSIAAALQVAAVVSVQSTKLQIWLVSPSSQAVIVSASIAHPSIAINAIFTLFFIIFSLTLLILSTD